MQGWFQRVIKANRGWRELMEQPFKTPAAVQVTRCYCPEKSSICASISGICVRLCVFCSVFSLNLPLDQSVCAVPVWPWQSFPCQWSSVAGSFQCAAAHLNIKRWSYDIVRRESGWTSQCPSLNGWLIGRYAVIKQETHTSMNWQEDFQIFSDFSSIFVTHTV